MRWDRVLYRVALQSPGHSTALERLPRMIYDMRWHNLVIARMQEQARSHSRDLIDEASLQWIFVAALHLHRMDSRHHKTTQSRQLGLRSSNRPFIIKFLASFLVIGMASLSHFSYRDMFVNKTLCALIAISLVSGQTNSGATTSPKKYGVILFPGFTALDVFGPLDVLNHVTASDYKANLSIIASTLEPVSTHLNSDPGVGSNFAQHVVPTHTFKHPPRDLDVLLVPGGPGTFAPAPALLDAITYIKDVYPRLEYVISVCTGATLLARAGVLDGRRATTNKSVWAWATARGPNVTWVPTARWVVDGNVWTTSGVSAGIDGIYGFVGHLYGEDYSKHMADSLEYERHTNASWDPFSVIWNVPGATNSTGSD